MLWSLKQCFHRSVHSCTLCIAWKKNLTLHELSKYAIRSHSRTYGNTARYIETQLYAYSTDYRSSSITFFLLLKMQLFLGSYLECAEITIVCFNNLPIHSWLVGLKMFNVLTHCKNHNLLFFYIADFCTKLKRKQASLISIVKFKFLISWRYIYKTKRISKNFIHLNIERDIPQGSQFQTEQPEIYSPQPET